MLFSNINFILNIIAYKGEQNFHCHVKYLHYNIYDKTSFNTYTQAFKYI